MAASREAVLSSLVTLTGDLQPTQQATASDLDFARAILAQALASEQAEPIAKTAVLARLAEPDLVAEARPATAAQLSVYVERALAAKTPPEFLIYRREVPVLTTRDLVSLPTWAAGRAIERTLGPFRDAMGRFIWFDLFPIAHQFNLVRTPGGAPFLTVPLRGLAFGRTRFTVGSGSIWFASKLVAPNGPVGGYTGLRIKGGTLTFSQAVSAIGTEVVVPPGVSCALEVQLDPPVPPTGIPPTQPGVDAREAAATFPVDVTLTVRASGATLASREASVQAYGTTARLRQDTGVPTFSAALDRLLVPFKADIGQFEVRHHSSTLFEPDGRAPMTSAAWALPVAVANPGTLGEASGVGELALGLDDGLSARWKGQGQRLALGPCVVLVDAEQLAVTALAVKGVGAHEVVELWSPDGVSRQTSRLTLTNQISFPVRFFSQAAGSEALLFAAHLEATLDRPLTLDGNRVPLQSPAALIVLFQIPAGTFLGLEAAIAPPRDSRRSLAFAAANVVFKSSPAISLIVFGGFDGHAVTQGALALTFRLQLILPTLPDPYAANYSTLEGSGRQPATGGTLMARVDWAPASATALRFLFPPTAGTPAPLARSQPGARAVVTSGSPGSVDEAGMRALAATAAASVEPGLVLLDVSTNADWFGVSVGAAGVRGASVSVSDFVVEDMYLQGPGSAVQVITVPEVQWEPVATPVPSPDDPNFPTPMTFPDSGGPSLVGVETVRLVRVAPVPALDEFIHDFNDERDPRPGFARVTLPFGIVALAALRKPQKLGASGAALDYNRPRFPADDLIGGHQISITAVGATTPGATASLPGAAVQLRNGFFMGLPTGLSVLDVSTIAPPNPNFSDTFNNNFGPGAKRQQVPVTRIDLSGYGESLFSDWRNPSDAAAVVSQARFDVIVGRTSLEIIQFRSVLYPYAVRVVRTVTIQRLNSGTVARHDSGWQAVTDGRYLYPDYRTNPDINPSPGITTHPGVVLGVRRVTNIRDTGQTFTTTKYGTALMAVRFDGDLDIEGVIKGGDASGVPGRDQLGFVQLTDPQKIGLLDPEEYAELIARNGPLGGTIDCLINIGGSGQSMRVTGVGVGATQGMGGFEFAMTAWGSPLFPQGGQWSFLRQAAPGDAPQPVDRDLGVPLIRAGAAPAPPPPSSPYRFADAVDLAQPASPASDYGILHATGTQRVFFPRPKIEASGPSSQRITSTQTPVLADPYTLATAVGSFPRTADAIPFPGSNWALAIGPDGNYKLELPSPSFPVTVGQRTLADAMSVRGYADYSGSTAEVVIDTANAVPWAFRLTDVKLALSAGLLGEVIRLQATVDATAVSPTQLKEPKIILGGALSPVQDVITILEDLGIPTPFSVSMSNQPERQKKLKAGLKIPLKIPYPSPEGRVKFIDLTVPPIPPGLTDEEAGTFEDSTVSLVFEDTDVSVTESLDLKKGKLVEAEFELEATLRARTSFTPPVWGVGLFKLNIKVGTESGTLVTLTAGAGAAIKFKFFLEFKGYYIATLFVVAGDTAFALGVGALAKLNVDLGVADLDLTAEVKYALLKAPCAAGLSVFAVAQVTLAAELTIAFVIDISFEYQMQWHVNMNGGPCPLPDAL
ncbi:MAG TPA: hypothetical protein VFP86_02215 [bacterium]|nr:hypothetical protein [bacterium]